MGRIMLWPKELLWNKSVEFSSRNPKITKLCFLNVFRIFIRPYWYQKQTCSLLQNYCTNFEQRMADVENSVGWDIYMNYGKTSVPQGISEYFWIQMTIISAQILEIEKFLESLWFFLCKNVENQKGYRCLNIFCGKNRSCR